MNNMEELDSYQESIMRDIPVKKHFKGPAKTSFRAINATSYSSSSCNFTLEVPSNGTIIDKRLWLSFPVNFYAGAALTGAPKDFPVNNMIQTASINFGGNSLNSRPSDLAYGLVKYAGYAEYLSSTNMTPTQQDLFADLNAAPATTGYVGKTATGPAEARAGGTDTTTFYAVDNPQSPFLTRGLVCANEIDFPRGAFPRGGGNGDSAGTAIQYTFTEPLLHGALADASEKIGMGRINKIDITLNFYAEAFERMWSSTTAIAGGVAVLRDYPKIWVRYITPSVEEIPAVVYTPYKHYLVQSQTIATAIAAGASQEVNINNFNMSIVPSTIYIFGRPTTPTTRHGRFYLRPTRLEVTCGNSQGLLTGLDEDMLFELSRDNGLKQVNYINSKTIGFPVCLDVATDLNQRVGAQTNFNFSFTGTFINPAGSPATQFDIVMITVTNGHLEIAPSSVKTVLGINEMDMVNLIADQSNTEEEATPVLSSGESEQGNAGFHNHMGNGSFKSFLKVMKKAAPIVKDVAKYAVPGLSKIAEMTGMDRNPLAAAALGALEGGNTLIGNGYGRQRLTSGRGTLGAGRMLS